MRWGAAQMVRMDQDHLQQVRCAVAVVLVMLFTLLSGCVAQQADLKQTERALQQKQRQDDQLSRTRARQSQEISTCGSRSAATSRGLEKARHQAEELQSRQEDLKHRSRSWNSKRRRSWNSWRPSSDGYQYSLCVVQKSLETQDAKVNARLDELSTGGQQGDGRPASATC